MYLALSSAAACRAATAYLTLWCSSKRDFRPLRISTVSATLGRPSGQGLLNDVGWFYVQSRWKQSGALAPKEIDRQVVSITFTEEGKVENVERFGLENGQVVAISRRVTDSNIKGVGFLRQLLGNIGRLRADQFIE